ncbi:MAG: alpha/beta hydrolase [Chitinophagales bacterium]|nr:alpha/beta hydrolase [Chitinophagales bacterium]
MRARLIIFLLVVSCLNAWALAPRATYSHMPEEFDMPYEPFEVMTADSATLTGWFFSPKSMNNRVILVCHDGQGNMSDYLERVDFLVNLDFNVILFDYRGYGKSSPFKIDTMQYIYPEFAEDVRTMIKFGREYSSYPIVVYGWGIGAGLGLSIGFNDDNVLSVIAESPFLTLSDLNKRFVRHHINLKMPEQFDAKLEPYNSLSYPPGKNLKQVLLIISDHFGIFSNREMLMLKMKQPDLVSIQLLYTTYWNDPFKINPSLYFEKVADFLDDYF